MKLKLLLSATNRIILQGHFLGISMFLGASASAQPGNLVYNPGFELPFGTNGATCNAFGGANLPLGLTTGTNIYDPAWKTTGNWMIAYTWGGPDDFEIKDRGTYVHGQTINGPNYFSACLRPGQEKWMHAYYTQTITNLQAAYSYSVSGWMMEDRWKGPASDDARRFELQVYIEAIGGEGEPTPDGRASVLCRATVDPLTLDNPLPDYPGAYPSTSWLQFTNHQTPDTNGEIEIRLHVNKPGWVIWDKLEKEAGYFDDIALLP